MLSKQFDVTKLIKMVNLTQILLSALLTREEQLLLLFQRRQIIETDADESGSDQSFTGVFQSKIDSKNPWDRIFVVGKALKILRGMEDEPLKVVSKKLIKGIYMRNLNEYQYLMKKQDAQEEDKEHELTDPNYYENTHVVINEEQPQPDQNRKQSQLKNMLGGK